MELRPDRNLANLMHSWLQLSHARDIEKYHIEWNDNRNMLAPPIPLTRWAGAIFETGRPAVGTVRIGLSILNPAATPYPSFWDFPFAFFSFFFSFLLQLYSFP
jgi:hypothetical protein